MADEATTDLLHTNEAHQHCNGLKCEVKRMLIRRSMSKNFDGRPDMDYLQAKISAAGYMRKSIQKLIDYHEAWDESPVDFDAFILDIKLSIENYLNCTPPDLNGDTPDGEPPSQE